METKRFETLNNLFSGHWEGLTVLTRALLWCLPLHSQSCVCGADRAYLRRTGLPTPPPHLQLFLLLVFNQPEITELEIHSF